MFWLIYMPARIISVFKFVVNVPSLFILLKSSQICSIKINRSTETGMGLNVSCMFSTSIESDSTPLFYDITLTWVGVNLRTPDRLVTIVRIGVREIQCCDSGCERVFVFMSVARILSIL